MQLRSPQPTGCQGNSLTCKTGTAQQSAPLPLGVQHVVDMLSLLMATARQKDFKSGAKSGVENADAGATGATLEKSRSLPQGPRRIRITIKVEGRSVAAVDGHHQR